MACIRKRRGHWCLDYRDQQSCRHWETTKGNRKKAEGCWPSGCGKSAGAPTGDPPNEHPKRIQVLMGHSSISVTMDVYGHLMPWGGESSHLIDFLVARDGIEPPTQGFSVPCSTD